jgi:hypothetical protein
MMENDKKIMRGEFRGDFTRDTFDPMKSFSRVLMQQGRVQLDADWNEQISILLHYMRNMACDIGGPHWGPLEGAGFEIKNVNSEGGDFSICAGHYYVKGILCELAEETSYKEQPNYPLPDELPELVFGDNKTYLVYLDVWERHISYVEDDAIREVALGGPDTASRAQIIWQVKVIENIKDLRKEPEYSDSIEALKCQQAISPGTGRMRAKAMDKPKNDKEPCLIAPESRYRGAENQLYRVEIHSNSQKDAVPTFKWSRENGRIIFPILASHKSKDSNSITLVLEHFGRDGRCGLKENDWVEIVDDDYILQNRAENLLQVISVDHENRQVALKWQAGPFNSTVDISAKKSPYLRRWNQNTGNEKGIPITNSWIHLEAGIQIQFLECNALFQTGDYWLIPARTVTGNIEWPEDAGVPKAMLPHGVIHHYAPLAMIDVDDCGVISEPIDLRRKLIKIWE